MAELEFNKKGSVYAKMNAEEVSTFMKRSSQYLI
jgi:hypothetical protein